jgi:hypothetical protein
MGIILVYTTFLTLLLLLIIVSSYFIKSITMRNLYKKRLRSRKAKIAEVYADLRTKYSTLYEVPKSIIDKLRRLSLNRVGLEAFTDFYLDVAKKARYSDEICDFAAKIIDFETLTKTNIVRNEYRMSYILFLLSSYRIRNEHTKELALRSLDDRSMYVRNNALLVIKNSGDADLVIKALGIIGKEKRFFNSKSIVDFFDTFSGDYNELSEALVLQFDTFSVFIKRLIPGHFMNRHNDSEAVRQLMLRCLEDSDKELIIAATKYFGWVNEPRAGLLILKNLSNDEWEVRALSARISQRGYNIDGMSEALFDGLSDYNWFVRQNCAFAYVAIVHGERRYIKPIIEGNDRYAREVILYVMFTKDYLGYDLYQYIMRYQDFLASIKSGEIPPPDVYDPLLGIKTGIWEWRAYYAVMLTQTREKDDLLSLCRNADEDTVSAVVFSLYMKDLVSYEDFEQLTSEKKELLNA